MRSNAGVLVLVNNDNLSGELATVDLQHIYWQSPVLGRMKIPKRSVKRLDTSNAFKLRGARRPCFWVRLEEESAIFSCSIGGELSVPFLSMTELAQYETHGESLHGYEGKLSVLGSKQTGNRERQDWVADASVTLRFSDFRHDIDALYELRSSNGNDPAKEVELEYSFDWFFKPRWFWFSDVTLTIDEPRGIKLRSAVGSGVGYQFWERKRSAFSLELGVDLAEESYFSEPLEEDIEDRGSSSWLLSTEYRYLLPMAVELSHRNQFLVSSSNPDVWEVETQTRLRVPIGQKISANVRFDYDYDNDPVEGNVKDDSALRFGIGYSW